MTLQEFLNLSNEYHIPDDLPDLLKALIFDANDDWDRAHSVAQDIFSEDGSWLHAYLHRKEGDLPNAAYWYGNAGRKMPDIPPGEEWKSIASELLKKYTGQ